MAECASATRRVGFGRLGRLAFLVPITLSIAIALLTNGAPSTAQGSGPVLPTEPFAYQDVELPEHFRVDRFPDNRRRFTNAAVENDNTPADNRVTDLGATLGRVLFYDENLSANATTSCASCHLQEAGFSDPRQFSEGFDGEETRRHSMSLVNARFYAPGSFFWDGRTATLEEQVLEPFQDEIEMGLTLDALVSIVQGQPYYAQLFQDAFGDEQVTADRISLALAQFVRSIVSFDSPYDVARAQVETPVEPFPNFTDQENLGKDLFMSAPGQVSCSGCHVSEAFVTTFNGPRNNGLDSESVDDLGQFEATENPNHIGRFKSPSLRNIAVTAPYMHDGRFESLAEVVEHYSTGVQDHPTLPVFMRDDDGRPQLREFSVQESAALVAFLLTLTDEGVLTDVKFSNPFPTAVAEPTTESPDPVSPEPSAIDSAPSEPVLDASPGSAFEAQERPVAAAAETVLTGEEPDGGSARLVVAGLVGFMGAFGAVVFTRRRRLSAVARDA